jgi:hypothetical protein
VSVDIETGSAPSFDYSRWSPTFSGPGIGKEYIALLPNRKLRRVGVVCYMENPILGPLLGCIVESRRKPGVLYFHPVAPGCVLADYDPARLEEMRGAFRAAQGNLLPEPKDPTPPIDLSGSYLQPMAHC